MINTFKIFCLVAFSILLLQSCGTQDGNTSSNKDFSKLGNDEEFKNAHENPKTPPSKKLSGEMIELATTGDLKTGNAYLVKASTPSDKYLLMIHEWYGLNENIKQEADKYQNILADVNVIALDLYDGKVADNRDDAAKYMEACKPERAEAIIKSALKMAGDKVATVGWCFGGGWSLKSSIIAGEQSKGCVIYYGMPEMDAKKLAQLQADVLGLFGSKDKWITPEVVTKFEGVMKAVGKKVEVHQFDADHAFANPSSERYDSEAAKKANELCMDFLRDKLK